MAVEVELIDGESREVVVMSPEQGPITTTSRK